MLEKPTIEEQALLLTIESAYGIHGRSIDFLPLGADLNSAVYRLMTEANHPYFLKLRGGTFDERSVTVPAFLQGAGVPHLIAPLATKAGQLWATFETYTVLLYPFVEGKNGYEIAMSAAQWNALGVAFKQIHTTPIPPALQAGLQRESYTDKWRQEVKQFLARTDGTTFTDPIAVEMFAFLAETGNEILALVEQTERLAQAVQQRNLPFVLCHADIHAGNVLLEADGTLHIVDWDTLVLAPKERDLMYFGAGLWSDWQSPQEEVTLFFQGYGENDADLMAIAYYRYERIIQDLAVSFEHIVQTEASEEDRALSLYYLKGNFLPNSTIALARQSDALLG